MAVSDALYNLYQRAQEKYTEGSNRFEEHFTWLEEVVAVARQTFITADPALLPKTPGAKKTTRQKRPYQPVLTEVSESPPSKRVSLDESANNENAQTPVQAPRRGRAAAQVARNKTKQYVQQSNKHKLRRPSTPEDSRKRKNTQSISEARESLGKRDSSEIRDKTPKKQTVKIIIESNSPEKEVMECGRTSPDVKFEERMETETEVLAEKEASVKEEEEEENMVQDANIPDCTHYDLRLEDSEENEEKEADAIKSNDDEVFESNEIIIESKSSTVSSSNLHEEPMKTNPSPKASSNQRVLHLSSSDDYESKKPSASPVIPPVPKPRSTRTKQKKDAPPPSSSSSDDTNIHMLPPKDLPKTRVTRTKTKAREPEPMSESDKEVQSSSEEVPSSPSPVKPVSKPEEPPKRSTRTKVKQAAAEKEEKEVIEISDSPKSRSTRTKKRQVTEEAPEQPTRSTRTKRKKVEEIEPKAPEPERTSFHLTLSDSEEESGNADDKNATYVKDKKRNSSLESVSSEASFKSTNSTASAAPSVVSVKNTGRPQGRVTRSKVRPLPNVRASPKVSPAKRAMSPAKSGTPGRANFSRGCCTPKSESGTPQGSRVQQLEPHARSPVKYSPRPFASKKTASSVRDMAAAYQNYCGDNLNEVDEMILSPVRVTRHSRGNAEKRESAARRMARKSLKRAKEIVRAADRKNADTHHKEATESRGARINPVKTPSPTCPTDKIIRTKPGILQSGSSTYGSSGRVTPKTFSRIRPTLTSSNEYPKIQRKIGTPTEGNRTKAIFSGTPNEAKRTKNIISGVTSFIKTVPSKPTREEIEEKKQIEYLKKKEREEDSRRKKEELLKSKAEDQRRRNEERMRRVQEAREERERKAVEAKEQQERDRRQREERLKEEQQRKKQQALAKKRAEEEERKRKIREQQEEEERRRQQEEERRLEEERRVEEARRAEEERRAYLAEQKRLHEEEKKKRIAEAERILRERKEMEALRLREAERLAKVKAAAMKPALNDTYTSDNKENSTKHNSTFTKPTAQSGKERSDSYEMTPETKKPKKLNSINNYDINDINSEDSTDDESAPKKRLPPWAQGSQMKMTLINQEYYPPKIDNIFPPEELLTMPDLSQIFSVQRRRFFKRTSSAIWSTPPSKLFEAN